MHKQLQLIQSCSLKCLNCPWWKSTARDTTPEFSFVPRTRVDVIGGEPLMHPQIDPILKKLRAQGCDSRLWTTGVGPVGKLEHLLEWVDSVVLFIPMPDADSYLEFCGLDGWDRALETLSIVTQLGKPIWVTTLVSPLSLSDLPNLFDTISPFKVPFIVQYHPSDGYRKKELDYVLRYRYVRHSFVLKRYQKPETTCQAVPSKTDFRETLQWGWIEMKLRFFNQILP